MVSRLVAILSLLTQSVRTYYRKINKMGQAPLLFDPFWLDILDERFKLSPFQAVNFAADQRVLRYRPGGTGDPIIRGESVKTVGLVTSGPSPSANLVAERRDMPIDCLWLLPIDFFVFGIFGSGQSCRRSGPLYRNPFSGIPGAHWSPFLPYSRLLPVHPNSGLGPVGASPYGQ